MKKTFNQVVRNIKDADYDTNRVLKAAKLQRNPANSMTGQQKFDLIVIIIGLLAFLGFFSLLVLGTILR